MTGRLLAIVAGVATLAALAGSATAFAAASHHPKPLVGCAPSGTAVARIKMTPEPIATFGSLGASQSAPFAALALSSTNNCVPGAHISLTMTGGPGTVSVSSSACGGATQLGTSPVVCTTDSTGRVAMTLTTPSSIPPSGSLEVNATDGAAVQGHVFYLYEYLYRFSASPIAPSGSLAGSTSVPITLQVSGADGSNTLGVGVYLSLVSTASPQGTATVQGSTLTSTPKRFTVDSNGQIQLTYKAPSSPPSSGIDTIFAASSVGTAQVANSTAYAFAAGYPTLSVGDVAQVEGDAAPDVFAEFNVTLSAPQSTAVTVQYYSVCGVGDKGCKEDYLQTLPGGTAHTVTIPAGQVRGQINVRVYSYSATESYIETYWVRLYNPVGAILGRTLGNGLIIQDDETQTVGILYAGDVGVVRSKSGTQLAEFTVTLSSPSTSSITFAYATQDGTAHAGVDYTAVSGTATITAGLSSAHIQVPILASSGPGPLTFTVTISGPSGATIARATGTGTIT